jgi:hypothetical protein
MKTTWTPVAATLNYRFDGFLAVYQKTVRGFASYLIYAPDGSLWGSGGLPETI